MEKKTKTVENKPKMVKQFRAGQITATVFEKTETKDGKEYSVYNVKISKGYTLDDGKTWNETNNYTKMDLVKVQIVTNKAIEFLYLTD